MSFSVIIPSKNADNLEPCVTAIRQRETDARIIVVDDGVEFTEDRDMYDFGDVCWVPGIKPFIFSRNVNIGIRAAGSDDVVILGDDGLLQTPGGFSLLAREAEAHPEFGIISATCNNTGNPNQHPKGIGLREDPRQVCFIAVYIPRRTIETVGLLDEEFIHYGLDDDSYCLRIRRAGLKIGIHDGAYVDHGSLTSTFRGAAGAGGNFRPNLKIFIQKYGVDNWGQPKETSQFPELFS